MTDDVDKSFFDLLAQLKELNSETYYKVLKEFELQYDEKET